MHDQQGLTAEETRNLVLKLRYGFTPSSRRSEREENVLGNLKIVGQTKTKTSRQSSRERIVNMPSPRSPQGPHRPMTTYHQVPQISTGTAREFQSAYSELMDSPFHRMHSPKRGVMIVGGEPPVDEGRFQPPDDKGHYQPPVDKERYRPQTDEGRYIQHSTDSEEGDSDEGLRSPEGKMLLSKTEGLDIKIPTAEYTASERSERRSTSRKKYNSVGMNRTNSASKTTASSLGGFNEKRRSSRMTSESSISLSKKGNKRGRGKKKKSSLTLTNKSSSDGTEDGGDHGDYVVDTEVKLPATMIPTAVVEINSKTQEEVGEENEKVLRKFNEAPKSKPKRIIFDHPGTDLTYIDVKRAIEKVIPEAFTEKKVVLIQFENRNIKLNTDGIDNRWHIELSNFPTRNTLLKSGLSFRYRLESEDGTFMSTTRHCKLKLYDLVTTEEYKRFLRSIADKDKLQTFILSTTGRIKSKGY